MHDIKNPLKENFYANVIGRAMDGTDSPTAPSAIKDILENELEEWYDRHIYNKKRYIRLLVFTSMEIIYPI